MKIFALGIALLIPSLAMAQEATEWSMVTAKKEIQDLKKRVEALEAKWEMVATGEAETKDCPCPEGGKCICPAGECDCPNCPIHHADTTWKGTKPTNKGREVLYFGADWCANCPAAVDRLGELTKQIYYIDCSKDDTLAAMNLVDSYPTLIALDDGIKVDGHHTEGNSVGSFLASKWLGRESPAPRRAAPAKLSYRAPEPRRVYSSAPRVSYSTGGRSLNLSRMPGPSWSQPGDLRSHLINEHGYSPSQINGLSYSQLNVLKDNDHNSWGHGGHPYAGRSRSLSYSSPPSSYYRSSAPAYRPVTYFSSGPSYGGCPGGNCPR